MGLATHLGPWLLGTVRGTTGSTAGTIRNLGSTTVVQTASTPILYTNTSATSTGIVLPAGSFITNIYFDITTAFNAGTNNTLTMQTAGGTSLATYVGTGVNLPVGRAQAGTSLVFLLTLASVATIANVGTSDVIIQGLFTGTGGGASTGSCTMSIEYAVRLSDGSYLPTSTTGP